jgi:uncharacterized alkaline shock family protein YloU
MEVSPLPDDRMRRAGVNGGDGDRRLPCGVPLDALLDQVAERRPPRDPHHQQNCAHCRVALAELDDLWAPVRDLAGEPVHAPPGLLAHVMGRIRDISRNPWFAVVPGPTGGTRIAARVVAAVARLAAGTVPHVDTAIGRGRAVPDDPTADPATVAVAGTHVIVDLDIAVGFGASIPEVTRQVRAAVLRDLREHTGLTTTEVNITVVDVHLP